TLVPDFLVASSILPPPWLSCSPPVGHLGSGRPQLAPARPRLALRGPCSRRRSMAMPRRLPVPRGFRGARALPALLLGVLLAAATCRVQSAMYFAFAAPARAGPRLSLGSAAAPTGWGHTAAAPLPPAASPVARRVFGLGTSEILVILAIGALVLGPDALKNVAKEAGKAASDLKDVPDAFQDRGNEPGQEA
ncbi:unnamed protein product, partial [Prorocentrum cordatum]